MKVKNLGAPSTRIEDRRKDPNAPKSATNTSAKGDRVKLADMAPKKRKR